MLNSKVSKKAISPLLALIATTLFMTSYAHSQSPYQARILSVSSRLAPEDPRELLYDGNSPMESLTRGLGLLISQIGPGDSIACTASLVGPNLIVTAASCLFDRRGNPVQFSYFYPDHRRMNEFDYGRFPVRYTYMPKAFSPGAVNNENLHNNIVFIELGHNGLGETLMDLKEFIPQVPTYALSSPSANSSVATIGYPIEDRDLKMYGQDGCTLRRERATGLFLSDCKYSRGYEGAPVFIHSNYGKKSLGIILGDSPSGEARILPFRSEFLKMQKSLAQESFSENSSEIDSSWNYLHFPDFRQITVFVHNLCSQTIYASMSRRDNHEFASGRAQEMISIRPGQMVKLGVTHFSPYYLHVRTAENRLLIGSGRDALSLRSGFFNYRFATIDRSNEGWGDSLHRIENCN